MIEGVTDHDCFVYHYTSSATALDFILKSERLLLGSYERTNDPKETKAWEFGLLTHGDTDLNKYKMGEMSSWLSKEIKKRARLVCFTKDRGPLKGDHIAEVFQRGYTKPRMWAQYASNHKGVCLVFSKQLLLDSVKKDLGKFWSICGDVVYRNHPISRGPLATEFMLNIDQYEKVGPSTYVNEHIKTHFKELFFEKLVDWRDEFEWRIVAFANDDQQLFLPIRQALVGVMHGDVTEPDVSESLIQATTGWNGVRHMGISWKNSSPWYDYSSFGWKPGKISYPRRKN